MAAKVLTGNPIIVGSADTFATVPAAEAQVRIRSMSWEPGNAGVAGNTCIVAHADGSVIWAPVLSTNDLGVQSFLTEMDAHGLAITPPTNGKLYIYIA